MSSELTGGQLQAVRIAGFWDETGRGLGRRAVVGCPRGLAGRET